MKKIVYVTGNYGKYISVKEQFEDRNVDIGFYEYDFAEPNINDIEYISKQKAMMAYEILQQPCFVADTGFYIEEYPENPNYPGAFVKRSGISTDIDRLLKVMENVDNRKCYFLDCLTFYDGENFYTFYGKSEGILSYEKRGSQIQKAKSNLWYVFIPLNSNKTLAEMTDRERKTRNDNHVSATQQFLNWYQNEYIRKCKVLV